MLDNGCIFVSQLATNINKMTQTKKQTRVKRPIEEMMPKKEWLSQNEVCAFLDIHSNTLKAILPTLKKPLTISNIGHKRYFKISEIQSLLTENSNN